MYCCKPTWRMSHKEQLSIPTQYCDKSRISSPHEVLVEVELKGQPAPPRTPVVQHSNAWEAGWAHRCSCSREIGQQDGEQLEAHVAPFVRGGEEIPLGHDVPQRPQVLSVWRGPACASPRPRRLWTRCCTINPLRHRVLQCRQWARLHLEGCIICSQACLSRHSCRP